MFSMFAFTTRSIPMENDPTAGRAAPVALDERPPHPDRLPRREFLLERIEFEGALFQPPDILIHE